MQGLVSPLLVPVHGTKVQYLRIRAALEGVSSIITVVFPMEFWEIHRILEKATYLWLCIKNSKTEDSKMDSGLGQELRALSSVWILQYNDAHHLLQGDLVGELCCVCSHSKLLICCCQKSQGTSCGAWPLHTGSRTCPGG